MNILHTTLNTYNVLYEAYVRGVCPLVEVALMSAPYSSSNIALVTLLPRAICINGVVPSTPHASVFALKSKSVFINIGSGAFRAAQLRGVPSFTPFGRMGSGIAPASSNSRAQVVWFWFAARVRGVFNFLSILFGSAPWLKSVMTAVSLPLAAAHWRGVLPVVSHTSTSHGRLRSSCSKSKTESPNTILCKRERFWCST